MRLRGKATTSGSTAAVSAAPASREPEADAGATTHPRGARRKTSLSAGPNGSEGAKKTAAVVLEVLSGVRDTASAGAALGVSLSRYYVLEGRAVQGLVRALEPRPKGKQKSPEKSLEEAQREVVRLQRELATVQALLRVSQRSLGIKAASKPERRSKLGTSTEKLSKRKRRRRTVRRAAQVIERLRPALKVDETGTGEAAAERASAPAGTLREGARCHPGDPPRA
jgi:hypothetical protein